MHFMAFSRTLVISIGLFHFLFYYFIYTLLFVCFFLFFLLILIIRAPFYLYSSQFHGLNTVKLMIHLPLKKFNSFFFSIHLFYYFLIYLFYFLFNLNLFKFAFY